VSTAPATALVVDDEGMVRQLVRRMLEPEVCRVMEAEDGETALRLIERNLETIDVVLTDLLMPGIDGFDVVQVLTSHHPDLPIVCMSGFANQALAGRRLDVPFVPKPFTAEVLRSALEPLIERSRNARRVSEAERLRAGNGRGAAVDLVAQALELHRRRFDAG
jgi:two-component system, cell cycle sensor histidine kinase and response regulator CckA